jgi:hypothetical protein
LHFLRRRRLTIRHSRREYLPARDWEGLSMPTVRYSCAIGDSLYQRIQSLN